MEQNRINLHQGLVADGNYHKDINEFNSKYFSNDSTVKDLWEKLTKNSEYTKTLQQFYAKYACDLSWAKTTQYCGGSGGDNTNTSNYEIQWSKYPCVVELAKSKGVSISDNGSYLIGDFKYFAKGRKGILSTGKVTDFTCDDPEFKKSSSGSQSSGSQPVSGRKQPTQIPSELKDIDGVKKFQDWLDIYHPGWHRKYGVLNKNLLRGYGKYGPNTTRAWNNQSYKDEYLKTSNSGSTSNWQDVFPSCVKGLKGYYNPPNNYFLGIGTDTEGVQYQIYYFSQKLNTGQLCLIYNNGEEISKGYYSCTTNNQQITIKTLSNLSITGSVINPDSKDIVSSNQNDKTLPNGDDTLDYDRVTKTIGV